MQKGKTAYTAAGFANLDLKRYQRGGIPEAVYAGGKSSAQLSRIMTVYIKEKENCLITRLSKEKWLSLKDSYPEFKYSPRGQIAWMLAKEVKYINQKKPVALIAAGSSDENCLCEAWYSLAFMGIKSRHFRDCGIANIERIQRYLGRINDCSQAIVFAGMEGALPTLVSSLTQMPVLGVPVSSGYGISADGRSALNSMLSSCSPTVSVLNIDNGFGAACCAAALQRQIDE